MPRDPSEVIRDILKVLPESKVELRVRLAKIADDSAYLPPEYKLPSWVAMANALNRHIAFPPQQPYELEIFELVTGQPYTEKETPLCP